MRNFLNAKSMARDLREALAEKGHALPHGVCLELVAKQFGAADWNTLSALIARLGSRRAPLPQAAGWRPTTMTDATKFQLGLDPDTPGVALIEALTDPALGEERADLFGCLMQSVSAGEYRGRKLRLAARLQATEAGLGSIWMRVDDATGAVLRFDNMMERPTDGAITGTSEWTDRVIVLDVPERAESLHYGFFLRGRGQIRARGFDLTIVACDTPVTDLPSPRRKRSLPPHPVNLGFGAS
ncbi:hypothetical protein GCM10008171_32130 [Methylopila jiangsuensis]|uniref:Glyoxalase-related protein domain-containing protein n=1 Tax=Methylopila jiangsuensis TaxID=586230 RepID=A0A9W6JLK9_9HYPH|nr:glyoxalase superfamily protein [Methylopila jiangsuensis]MDR6284653.1 hypothetical protein [Methylopila jiangsuensis]GLK77959.1 hypothetical protein GCM10008171_32130 [Methylopila jiangsuensis]